MLGVAISGIIAGILVPFINVRLLRLAVGAGVWTLFTAIFLSVPFVYVNLLVPGLVIGVSCLISLLGGTGLGGLAAWVNLP